MENANLFFLKLFLHFLPILIACVAAHKRDFTAGCLTDRHRCTQKLFKQNICVHLCKSARDIICD